MPYHTSRVSTSPSHSQGMESRLPSPGDLPGRWRERARFLNEWGDPNSARLWRLAAAELEQALRALGEETLSLVEAAQLSGYTADHLGSLVRKSVIPNCGRKNAPRIRRADLPTKSSTCPGRPRNQQSAPVDDITHIASRLSLRREP